MADFNWKSIIDKDIPVAGRITAKTVEDTVKLHKRFRGSRRISTGKIWIDSEYEERRANVLNTSLR